MTEPAPFRPDGFALEQGPRGRPLAAATIAKFGDLLCRKLGEPNGRAREEYFHLLVDHVEVGDREVRNTRRDAGTGDHGVPDAGCGSAQS